MKQRWNRLRQFVSRHRLGVIVSSVIAVIAIAGGAYAAWSINSWQQYETTAAEHRQETVAHVQSALDMPTDTAETRTARFETLQEIARSQQATSACDVHGAMAWQTVLLGSLNDKVERCNAALETAANLQRQVEKTVTYLRSERELAAILQNVNPKQTSKNDEKDAPSVAEADFAANRNKWKEAAANVSKLGVGDAFSETKASMEERVIAVHDAWQTLVKAHEKKDRKAFERARGTLANTYQKLNETAEQSEKTHTQVMNALKEKLASSQPKSA